MEKIRDKVLRTGRRRTRRETHGGHCSPNARTHQDLKLHLAVVLVLVLVKIRKVRLDDAPLQVVGGHTHAGATGDQSLAHIADLLRSRAGPVNTATTARVRKRTPSSSEERLYAKTAGYLERRRGLDVIPVLLGESVYLLLSLALLTLTKALVLPASHGQGQKIRQVPPNARLKQSYRDSNGSQPQAPRQHTCATEHGNERVSGDACMCRYAPRSNHWIHPTALADSRSTMASCLLL